MLASLPEVDIPAEYTIEAPLLCRMLSARDPLIPQYVVQIDGMTSALSGTPARFGTMPTEDGITAR